MGIVARNVDRKQAASKLVLNRITMDDSSCVTLPAGRQAFSDIRILIRVNYICSLCFWQDIL